MTNRKIELKGLSPDQVDRLLPEGPKHTDGVMRRLAAVKPRTIVPMHGSTYVGDGERALRELAVVMRDVLG